ncbi:hypothetical protein HMPREF0973_01199 [Prevotella veroralis F0319]|uniref:Uncharacterized protein n=1 Tax=Prevotella veroralis F0319 TaxID=649761 RepID=C9MNL2_9BACT|nr:hypothetical protein HMPREF0973_01199 [Prevotella veroralis F0319]
MSRQVNELLVRGDVVLQVGTDALVWNPSQPPLRGGAPNGS